MTKYWIGTSWKMNKTLSESRHYAHSLVAALAENPDLCAQVQPFIIPPHTALADVSRELRAADRSRNRVILGAQNAHWDDAGAWTGEVSTLQVKDAGADLVEIGHSERREFFNDTNETVRWKVEAALRHQLTVLLCIGETADVRDAGQTVPYLLEQADSAVGKLSEQQLQHVLIAYEPVWAIGDNGRPASPDMVREPFAALRHTYGHRVGALLYGGSVTVNNASPMLGLAEVDGLFVGRAAWTVDGYLDLLQLAADHALES